MDQQSLKYTLSLVQDQLSDVRRQLAAKERFETESFRSLSWKSSKSENRSGRNFSVGSIKNDCPFPIHVLMAESTMRPLTPEATPAPPTREKRQTQQQMHEEAQSAPMNREQRRLIFNLKNILGIELRQKVGLQKAPQE